MSGRDELQARKRAREAASRITLGELRERLAVFGDDAVVTFGAAADGRNPLVFRRVKDRGPLGGPGLVTFELDELTDDEMDD